MILSHLSSDVMTSRDGNEISVLNLPESADALSYTTAVSCERYDPPKG